MNVIRLDRRYKLFQELGHTWCFKFPYWNANAMRVEELMTQLLGDQYNWSNYDNRYRTWRAQFGHKVKGETRRSYVISFRDESVISFIMLKLESAE